MNNLAFAQQSAFQQFEQEYNTSRTISADSAIHLVLAKLPGFPNSPERDEALRFLGEAYFSKGDLQLADSVFALALPGLQEARSHQSVLNAFTARARILQSMGRLADGIELINSSEKYIDRHQESLNTPESKRLIGAVYRTSGIFYAVQEELDGVTSQETAERYFRKAYHIFSEVDDPVLEGLALFNIGNVQLTEDSTIYYWEEALKVFEANNIEAQKQNVYQNLAILNIDKGEFRTGLDYLEKAKVLVSEDSDPFTKSLLDIKFGRAYLGLGQLTRSVQYLNQGLTIALDQDMLSLQGEAYELLIEAYQKQGAYQSALETYIKYDTLIARFDKLETERIYRETEARYKTKEQQDQIQLLQQAEALNEARIQRQQLIIVIVVFGLIFIGLLSYFLWKRAKERQTLNEQLKRLDQTRTRFLVNISHELRTPLTLVHAPIQDALEQIENKEYTRVKKDLQRIAGNTKKLIQLTDEVLDISKLDEGALKIELRAVPLQKFLTRVFFSFESLAIRQQLKWTCQVDLDENYYETDPGKLEKILNNLFSNAIKNTPKGGKIHFRAFLDQGKLRFSVSDTGVGIEASKIVNIFNRYYQAESGEKAKGGLGIGLAFVKELLDFMGGSIQVKSTPGEGSEFSVELAVTKTSAPSAEQEQGSEIESTLSQQPTFNLSDGGQPHVLVVEDNAEMAEFIQQLLSDEYRVTLADNGKEGIERLHSAKFDLITADVMMPEMDGYSFVKQVKAHHEWDKLPVILITALSEESDKVEGLRLGIDDYIPKPFSAQELKVRVRNLLQNAVTRRNEKTEKADEKIGNEQQLLNTAKAVVEERINDNSFGVSDLAERLNLSERQANRVLKKLTGLSCLQFIREIKLQRAYRMLESHEQATIAEVAYALGFENTSYFSRLFADRFGKKPSEML